MIKSSRASAWAAWAKLKLLLALGSGDLPRWGRRGPASTAAQLGRDVQPSFVAGVWFGVANYRDRRSYRVLISEIRAGGEERPFLYRFAYSLHTPAGVCVA